MLTTVRKRPGIARSEPCETRVAHGAVQSEGRNDFGWIKLEHAGSSQLFGRFIGSFTDVTILRFGSVAQVNRHTGQVSDGGTFHVAGVQVDFTHLSAGAEQGWGMAARRLCAQYE